MSLKTKIQPNIQQMDSTRGSISTVYTVFGFLRGKRVYCTVQQSLTTPRRQRQYFQGLQISYHRVPATINPATPR